MFLKGQTTRRFTLKSVPRIELIPIAKVHPINFQSRLRFDKEKLRELGRSLKATSGPIEPIVVRYVKGDYQLIAGEKRWRAAKVAGIPRYPLS
ncbi:hypothetical protein E6H33_06900 [Candidatus Bathyarchaeota archaeon]|nr:MAG: hypothetical protein E6H33_06900 [Candidatus Bathyarchaeota archaeon]